LLPLPRDWCADSFNLVQLPPVIEKMAQQALAEFGIVPTESESESATAGGKPFPLYRQALKLLVHDQLPYAVPQHVERAASALYLLLHQRYVLSPRGLDVVRRRLLQRDGRATFGRCPRIDCRGTPLLPCGVSDQCGLHPLVVAASGIDYAETRAKRYCPRCRQIYYHWDSKVDGCAWGSSFCHLFLMVCGEEVFGDGWREQEEREQERKESRIFGFRLHPSAQ
jgi:casein kinase II subunit beta